MKNDDQLTLQDLIHLKWAVKTLIDMDDEEESTNHIMYQKLSYLCEKEKTKLELELDKETWYKINRMLKKLEGASKALYESAIQQDRLTKKIIKIHETTYDDWVANGKTFLK